MNNDDRDQSEYDDDRRTELEEQREVDDEGVSESYHLPGHDGKESTEGSVDDMLENLK